MSWLKQNWFKASLGILLLIIISYLAFTFSIPEAQKLTSNIVNPIEIAKCMTGASVTYWDPKVGDPFAAYEVSLEGGSINRGYYIGCDTNGSSAVTDVYVFEGATLLLKRESIYHGRYFGDKNGNYFYVIEGEYGEANCCPSSYVLSQYKYNENSKTLELKNTKEYPTSPVKVSDGRVMYYNKELYDLEEEKSIESLGNWGGFIWE